MKPTMLLRRLLPLLLRLPFLGAVAAVLAVPPALAQFRVEIAGVGGTQLPIAVARFKDEDKAPQPVSAIVRADLERSGLFKLIEAPGVIDETAQPVMADWRARGADALLTGSVARLADGRYDLRYRLWDVVKGQPLLGQSTAVAAADLRLAAHRIADAVYEKLTGEKGVFSTRIAYVTKAGKQFTLRIADADGEGGQVALASPEPVISPAWSPDGRELAYVSFENQKAAVWVQDVATGKRRWQGGRYGHGQMLLCGDKLVILAESGELVLVQATPDAHRELGRIQAIEGKTWNNPAMVGNRVYVRNHIEMAAYELPVVAAPVSAPGP